MRWTLHGHICGVSDAVDLRDRDAGGVAVEPFFAQKAGGEVQGFVVGKIGRLRSVRSGTSAARRVLSAVRDGAIGYCGAGPLYQQVKAFGDGETYARYFFYMKVALAVKSILSNTDGPFADLFKQFVAPPAKPPTPPTEQK